MILFRLVGAAAITVIACGTVCAEVARVEISRREDVLSGRAFGHTGAYEKLYGRVYYSVSPDNPHNKIIVDLDKAPRNAKGRVEFSSDLFILRPKDPAKGNLGWTNGAKGV